MPDPPPVTSATLPSSSFIRRSCPPHAQLTREDFVEELVSRRAVRSGANFTAGAQELWRVGSGKPATGTATWRNAYWSSIAGAIQIQRVEFKRNRRKKR